MVDEWGCWFDVEPGTNPGFLYQQNTMRDALVACLSLNIFNKHSDRVKMANIAQLVNVLQSVILTEGPKMILTPTYYVFRMYKHHQNAQLLESYSETKLIGEGEYKVPNISESASIDDAGVIHVTLGNLSPESTEEIEIQFSDKRPVSVCGSVLSGKWQHITPLKLRMKLRKRIYCFSYYRRRHHCVTLPACSVVSLAIQ